MTPVQRFITLIVPLAVSLAVHIFVSTPASAQGVVSGTVLDTRNVPIPGLMVSLAHSIVGRSYPSFTDPLGRFVFYNVPPARDPYYLEIYWGRELLYRRTLFMNAPSVRVPTIVLR